MLMPNLEFTNKSTISDINYYVIDSTTQKASHQGQGMSISDQSANSMLAVGGTILSVMVGPIAIVPLALLGVSSATSAP